MLLQLLGIEVEQDPQATVRILREPEDGSASNYVDGMYYTPTATKPSRPGFWSVPKKCPLCVSLQHIYSSLRKSIVLLYYFLMNFSTSLTQEEKGVFDLHVQPQLHGVNSKSISSNKGGLTAA